MEGMKKPYRGAKIPTKENGIRVVRTVCNICSAGCNIDAYVEDGEVIKVMGCKDPNYGNGYLCARGHASRPYIYHQDRIKTPLRRTGERGEGKFEPITWEEAMQEIGKHFRECKEKYGASSVMFTGGYDPWEMAALYRLARGFGSVNCSSRSFLQRDAAHLASHVAAGCPSRADITHSGVVLMWGCNLYNHGNTTVDPALTQKRGAKVIAIDPRITNSSYRLADLHLRPRPGTDAALAHGLAHIFVEKGWIDKTYIARHVQGFFDYRAYINDFTPERVEAITGVPAAQLEAAAHIIMNNGPMSVMVSDGAFAEMRTGVQTRRAIEALCAITGNYDVRGGLLPCTTMTRREKVLWEFAMDTMQEDLCAPVGAQRYPLLHRFSRCCQFSDMIRQIREGTPYPVRGLCSFGLNIADLPGNGDWASALQELDFFVDVDLFMNRTASYADIVLPACSSFEKEQITTTPDHKIYDTPAIIEPFGASRPDLDIICSLARQLVPEDQLLGGGMNVLYEYWLGRMHLSLSGLRVAKEPMQMTEEIYRPGSYTMKGYRTPSGRYELKSSLPETAGLDALPVFRPGCLPKEAEQFPFVLSVGNQQRLGCRGRTRRIAWLRAMQLPPGVELHPEDARDLGIADGDPVELRTAAGALTVPAHLTQCVRRGMVTILPDCESVDICSILPEGDVDPCSGMPAFRTMRCRISKV